MSFLPSVMLRDSYNHLQLDSILMLLMMFALGSLCFVFFCFYTLLLLILFFAFIFHVGCSSPGEGFRYFVFSLVDVGSNKWSPIVLINIINNVIVDECASASSFLSMFFIFLQVCSFATCL